MNDKKTKAGLLDTLFYISSFESAKPEDGIDPGLIIACADEAGKLDPKYRTSEEERAAFARMVMDGAEKAPTAFRRTSKKLVVILVAAAILAVTALAVTAVVTDFFGLFFDDPREALEWKDGESRRIDDVEMIISGEVKEYAATGELNADFGDRLIIPAAPDGYEVKDIYYVPLENRREVTLKYASAGCQVQYTVQLDRESPTAAELSSCGYEKVETANGTAFYIMESVDGYQAMARIGGDLYIVGSAEKEDVILFIMNVEGL